MLQNPYLYLSLLALCIKIYAAYKLRKNLKVPGAKLCMIFLFFVYAQTVLELLIFYTVENPQHNILLLLKAYYLLLITSILIMPILFFNIIQSRINWLLVSIISLILIFMISMLDTNLMISGAKYTPYTITRIKGNYYWILQLFFIGSLLATISSLIHTYKHTKTELIKVKSINLLVAFGIVVLGGISIMILMTLKVPITGVGFVPILLSILIITMTEILKPDKIIDFRAFIPGTKKFKLIIQTIKPFVFCTSNPIYKNYYEHYDKSLISVADDQFSNNIEKAKWLGISEPTYYKKKAKLKNFKPKK